MPWPRPWLQAELTEADVCTVLQRAIWLSVPEIMRRMHVTRSVYRTQIAKLLRQAQKNGTVESRFRSHDGRGHGPVEYRRFR